MEPPNKLMIMQALGCLRYDSMNLNSLTRIFSGASCVIRGVLGEIGVTWPSGRVPWPSRYKSSGQVPSKHIGTRFGHAISQAGVPVPPVYLARVLASASDSAKPYG